MHPVQNGFSTNIQPLDLKLRTELSRNPVTDRRRILCIILFSVTPLPQMKKSVQTLSLSIVTALVASSSANAAVIASYVNGTDTGFAAGNNGTTSTIITDGGLQPTGINGRATTTKSGNNSPDGLDLPGGTANNWLLVSAERLTAVGTPNSADDYIGLTVVFQETATLASLSFNSINGSRSVGGGLETAFSVFASINSGAFTQVDVTKNSAVWTGGATGTNERQLGPQSAISFNLTSLGAFNATDTVELRLSMQDTSDTNTKYSFLKDISLQTVPEPSSALLLGCAGLFLGLRRRRQA